MLFVFLFYKMCPCIQRPPPPPPPSWLFCSVLLRVCLPCNQDDYRGARLPKQHHGIISVHMKLNAQAAWDHSSINKYKPIKRPHCHFRYAIRPVHMAFWRPRHGWMHFYEMQSVGNVEVKHGKRQRQCQQHGTKTKILQQFFFLRNSANWEKILMGPRQSNL